MEEWELGKLPRNAKKIGSFRLSQEETVKFGQKEADRKWYDACEIAVYNDAYVSFEAVGFHMVFRVSEEEAKYLRGYFE